MSGKTPGSSNRSLIDRSTRSHKRGWHAKKSHLWQTRAVLYRSANSIAIWDRNCRNLFTYMHLSYQYLLGKLDTTVMRTLGSHNTRFSAYQNIHRQNRQSLRHITMLRHSLVRSSLTLLNLAPISPRLTKNHIFSTIIFLFL